MKFIAIAALVAATNAVKLNRFDKAYTYPGGGFPGWYDEFPGTEEGAP